MSDAYLSLPGSATPAIASSSSEIPRPPKRRLTVTPDLSFFTPAAESFQPIPYNDKVKVQPTPPPIAPMIPNAPMDPSPSDPHSVFLHPPFQDFPGSEGQPDGLTYNVMAANPEWFLVAADFATASNPMGVPYPPQLEPPRGWCPKKKERGGDGWPEGEEPRLRCTFCRRTYAGVNAKSMWRRHVFEKHKVAMANRREGPDRARQRGRGCIKPTKQPQPSAANSENTIFNGQFPHAVSAAAAPSNVAVASSSKYTVAAPSNKSATTPSQPLSTRKMRPIYDGACAKAALTAQVERSRARQAMPHAPTIAQREVPPATCVSELKRKSPASMSPTRSSPPPSYDMTPLSPLFVPDNQQGIASTAVTDIFHTPTKSNEYDTITLRTPELHPDSLLVTPERIIRRSIWRYKTPTPNRPPLADASGLNTPNRHSPSKVAELASPSRPGPWTPGFRPMGARAFLKSTQLPHTGATPPQWQTPAYLRAIRDGPPTSAKSRQRRERMARLELDEMPTFGPADFKDWPDWLSNASSDSEYTDPLSFSLNDLDVSPTSSPEVGSPVERSAPLPEFRRFTGRVAYVDLDLGLEEDDDALLDLDDLFNDSLISGGDDVFRSPKRRRTMDIAL